MRELRLLLALPFILLWMIGYVAIIIFGIPIIIIGGKDGVKFIKAMLEDLLR